MTTSLSSQRRYTSLMRYLLLPLVPLLIGCGAPGGGGSSASSAPGSVTAVTSTDLIITGSDQTVVVPAGSHIGNIIITGDRNIVYVGSSSTIAGIVSFTGSLNEVHVAAANFRGIPTHQQDGDGNHLFGDSLVAMGEVRRVDIHG